MGTVMSKYQDEYSLWHDRPCVDGKPRSNNGWIYTAYSKYLAPGTFDNIKVAARFAKCLVHANPLVINRLPYKVEPPMSKDEIIGLRSLGYLSDSRLSESHYNFCNIDANFERKLSLKSIYRAVKALYAIRKEHRNYVWQNKVVEAYPLAFRLPPEDIYYSRKLAGKQAGIFNTIAFYLNTAVTMYNGNKSARMMLFLKLRDLKHPLLRFIPLKKYVLAYFGPQHSFYLNVMKGAK